MGKRVDLSNKAGIEKAIEGVSRRGKQLVNDCQHIAIAVMIHMDEHGDNSLVYSLCDAVETAFGATRRKVMQEFFLNYTHQAWDEENKKFFKDKSKSMNIEGARQAFWTETEPKTVPAPFDASKAVKSLVQRAEKAANREDETGNPQAVNLTIEEMRRVVSEHDAKMNNPMEQTVEKQSAD